MTTLSAGDIWIAEITFTDGSAAKKRPILVLWLDGDDAVVAAITSSAPRTPADVALADWQSSGLRLPSVVRLARLDCLEQSLLIARLGRVSSSDAQRLKNAWKAHIQPAF
jgi:mRNA interferase MazF